MELPVQNTPSLFIFLNQGAERPAVEISHVLRPPPVACKPKACVPPQMGFAHLGFPGSSSGVEIQIELHFQNTPPNFFFLSRGGNILFLWFI